MSLTLPVLTIGRSGLRALARSQDATRPFHLPAPPCSPLPKRNSQLATRNSYASAAAYLNKLAAQYLNEDD